MSDAARACVAVTYRAHCPRVGVYVVSDKAARTREYVLFYSTYNISRSRSLIGNRSSSSGALPADVGATTAFCSLGATRMRFVEPFLRRLRLVVPLASDPDELLSVADDGDGGVIVRQGASEEEPGRA